MSDYSPSPPGSSRSVPEPGSAPGSSAPETGEAHGNQRRIAPGTMLSDGRYQIEKLIASGGMGAVYKANDTRFNRPCAVKEMLDEFRTEAERAQAFEWFRREATLLLDLNHPCIPRVRDFFGESRHYLVMDFIEGCTLQEALEKESNVMGVNGASGVTEAHARHWAKQICSVLSYLHSQSPPIIFRDLKPSNIMVTGRDEIKLIDFGIARTFQSQRQSTIIMTVGYAPLEQLQGMAEPRSDIYALGATLHRLLTRHDPVNNKPSIFSFPIVRALRPDVSPAFDQVIMKALEPDLAKRWSSAAEMEKAIINLPAPSAGSAVVVMSPQGQAALPGSKTPAVPHGTSGPGGGFITAAQGLISSNRVEEAYNAVRQAHTLEPNNAMVHRIFGQVFARRRPPMIEQAHQAYSRSLQLNANDAETHKLIGDVYLYLQKQPLTAIPCYTQSLRLNPNDAEAHLGLGTCYEETNQLEAALREFQEAGRLAPKQARYATREGQLAMRLQQHPVAERAFVAALKINPADSWTRYLLSQVYENEGKLLDAERECSYVMVAVPEARIALQRIRSRLGR